MLDKGKIFFYDSLSDVSYSYEYLFDRINNIESLPTIIYTKNFIDIFVFIIASIIYNRSITLIDYDFNNSELQKLGINNSSLSEMMNINSKRYVNEKNFKELLNPQSWSVTLFTSGTTGQPKKISHTFRNLTRIVKVSENKLDDIWGFAYNPTHIAGLQVFLHSLLNFNTMINLFNQSKNKIYTLIEKFNITNLSSTPTFYRLLIPYEGIFTSVKKITSGGEKLNLSVLTQLSKLFPNAKIFNVYASTEAGSILVSSGETFIVKEKFKELIKIIDGELLLHKSLIGYSNNPDIIDGWYKTNDLVEVVKTEPLAFKFVSRKNEMIIVGGYKVNPIEVEEVINNYPCIKLSKVYGRKNSVLGNILVADIQTINGKPAEKNLRIFLNNHLQKFKVPRIINFVESIEVSRTGKLKRL